MNCENKVKCFWFYVICSISDLICAIEGNLICICSWDCIFQQLAVRIWEWEWTKSNICVLSCWSFVHDSRVPCLITWIWDGIWFIITALKFNCWCKIFVMWSTIQSISIGMDFQIETQSPWFNKVRLVFKNIIFNGDMRSISASDAIFPPFAIWIWVGKVSNRYTSETSWRRFVCSSKLPGRLVRIWNHVCLVVTSFNSKRCWEILISCSSHCSHSQSEG